MKSSFVSALLIIASLASSAVAFACPDGEGDHHAAASDSLTVTKASATTDANAATETTRVKIAGIHCESCQKSISSKLQAVDGFRSVKFEVQKNGKKSVGEKAYIAEVQHAPGKMNADSILKAIAEAGDYKATVLSAK